MARRADRSPLRVHVSFETTRISTQSLIDVYERLALIRRPLVKTPEVCSLADEVRAVPGRGGKHA